jgi:hypothetical protein
MSSATIHYTLPEKWGRTLFFPGSRESIVVRLEIFIHFYRTPSQLPAAE